MRWDGALALCLMIAGALSLAADAANVSEERAEPGIQYVSVDATRAVRELFPELEIVMQTKMHTSRGLERSVFETADGNVTITLTLGLYPDAQRAEDAFQTLVSGAATRPLETPPRLEPLREMGTLVRIVPARQPGGREWVTFVRRNLLVKLYVKGADLVAPCKRLDANLNRGTGGFVLGHPVPEPERDVLLPARAGWGSQGIVLVRPRLPRGTKIFVFGTGAWQQPTIHGHYAVGNDPRGRTARVHASDGDRQILDRQLAFVVRSGEYGPLAFDDTDSRATSYIADMSLNEPDQYITGIRMSELAGARLAGYSLVCDYRGTLPARCYVYSGGSDEDPEVLWITVSVFPTRRQAVELVSLLVELGLDGIAERSESWGDTAFVESAEAKAKRPFVIFAYRNAVVCVLGWSRDSVRSAATALSQAVRKGADGVSIGPRVRTAHVKTFSISPPIESEYHNTQVLHVKIDCERREDMQLCVRAPSWRMYPQEAYGEVTCPFRKLSPDGNVLAYVVSDENVVVFETVQRVPVAEEDPLANARRNADE